MHLKYIINKWHLPPLKERKQLSDDQGKRLSRPFLPLVVFYGVENS